MKKKYVDLIKRVKLSDEYWAETAISDFTEELCILMDEKGISRSELAKRIGKTPAYVTKVLRGNVNFTLLTMTKLARALGVVVRVHLAPNGAIVHWVEETINFDSEIDLPLDEEFDVTGIEYFNFKSTESGTSQSELKVA